MNIAQVGGWGGGELVRVAVAMTSYLSLPTAFFASLSQIMRNYFLFFFFFFTILIIFYNFGMTYSWGN
jgi:type II secretory pathway component PulF